MAQPIEVLLVGARVAQLKPHFEVRGFRCDAFIDGSAALKALASKQRELVVLEINLGDQSAPDFVEQARGRLPHAAYLLLDDASRAGQIVKALQAGVTHYLPTPPDEERLFRDVEHLVVFSRAMSGDLERLHRLAVSDAQAAAERAQSDAANAVMQSDLVQQELLTATKERDDLHEELESLKRRVDELGGQGVASAARIDELEATQRRADDAATESASRIAELEAALQEQTALAEQRGADLARAERDIARLEQEKIVLDERAMDLELQVDEITTKLSFVDEQRRKADEHAQEVEARFKKDRLRLIEEKQHAAAGSHEAYQKMEKLVGELGQLRAGKAEAEAKLRELEARLALPEAG